MKIYQKHAVNDDNGEPVGLCLRASDQSWLRELKQDKAARGSSDWEPTEGVTVSFVLKVLRIDHKTHCVSSLHHCGGMTGSAAGLRRWPHGCIMQWIISWFSTNCVYCITYLTKYFRKLFSLWFFKPASPGVKGPVSDRAYGNFTEVLMCLSHSWQPFTALNTFVHVSLVISTVPLSGVTQLRFIPLYFGSIFSIMTGRVGSQAECNDSEETSGSSSPPPPRQQQPDLSWLTLLTWLPNRSLTGAHN